MKQTDDGKTAGFCAAPEYRKAGRLRTIERIMRSGGYDTELSEDCVRVKWTCRDGQALELEATPSERSVEFRICLPFALGNRTGAAAEAVCRLNGKSMKEGHVGFFSAADGRICLCRMEIDDGHLNEMDLPVRYIVSDLLGFAEEGLKALESGLSETYEPAPSDRTGIDMYR